MPRGDYAKANGWPQAAVDILRRALAGGASFQDAARTLYANGHPFTRNACIGKAKRLGIVSNNGPASPEHSRSTFAKRKRMSPRSRPLAAPQQGPVTRESDTGIELRDDFTRVPGGQGGYKLKRKATKEEISERKKGHIPNVVEQQPESSIHWAKAGRTACKWPTSDDAQFVCGQPSTVGAYCDRHAQLAYRTMPSRRRNGTFHKESSEYAVRSPRIIDDAEVADTIEHFLEQPKSIGLIGPYRGPGSEFETILVDAFIAEHVIDD